AQGRAQALNLRDSGADVRIGLRAGSASRAHALADDLAVCDPATLAAESDVIVMLVPDTEQAAVYADIAPQLRAGACLLFAHGYAFHFEKIRQRPDLDVVMVAPMGIGEQVREVYARGAGVPGLLAVHQDASGNARRIAEAYAKAMGHGHAGVIETTFAEETE